MDRPKAHASDPSLPNIGGRRFDSVDEFLSEFAAAEAQTEFAPAPPMITNSADYGNPLDLFHSERAEAAVPRDGSIAPPPEERPGRALAAGTAVAVLARKAIEGARTGGTAMTGLAMHARRALAEGTSIVLSARNAVPALAAGAAVIVLTVVAFNIGGLPLGQPERTSGPAPGATPVTEARSIQSEPGDAMRGIPRETAPAVQPTTGDGTAPGALMGRADERSSAPAVVPPSASPRSTTVSEARPSPAREDVLDVLPATRSDALRTESGRSTQAAVVPAVITPPANTGIDALPSSAAREAVNIAPPAIVPDAPVTSSAAAVPVPAEPRPIAAAPNVDRSATTLSTAGATVVTPVTLTPDAAIEKTLQGYQAAFSRLDVAAVREVWPSVDGKALAKAFDQLHREDLTFDSCQVTVTGATALAACGGRTEYVPKVGNKNPRIERNRWRISLRRAADEWVVTRVDVSSP